MLDDNPRPQKRQRKDSSSPTTGSFSPSVALQPLPPAVLLVSLPGLLAHPPNHRFYIRSLVLSLISIRKCLALPALAPETECRAWTSLAEIGMRVIAGGLSQSEDYPWAKGIEIEVDKAISRGSIIAQKHPSLRAYKHHLALLQAQFSHWQHKTKFARTQLRNLLTTFLPTDPPYIVYSAHLAAISLYTTPTPAASSSQTTEARQTPQDIHAALSAVQTIAALSQEHNHPPITLFAHVLRLRILVAAHMWSDVADALRQAERALGLSYDPASAGTPTPAAVGPSNAVAKTGDKVTFVSFEIPLEAAMAVHTLIMGVVYYTHVGASAEASPRLTHLHALLDSGALEKFPEGIVEVYLPTSPPLVLQVTHPRVLFLLAFLVSSVAKRDAVGRKPKRKVFATEGLAMWEQEFRQELRLPLWAGMGDVEEIEQRLARIKADMMCEVVAVSIMRSEFDAAEENLAAVIAHTRTYAIFPYYAARIPLHHAHLAHALGQTGRALECYRVAAHVAEEGSFVRAAARAGEVALRVGCAQVGTTRGQGEEWDDEGEGRWGDGDAEEVDAEEAMEVVRACRGMGGTLEAVGQVIEACFTSEILKAKQHLKSALALATQAQDNHLRALILALIASHYMHTAGEHAQSMLQTCQQLAAGLGAPPVKGATSGAAAEVSVGNAPLGLWVGERFLELYKRAGKDARAAKQAAVNAQLAKAVEAIAARSKAAEG